MRSSELGLLHKQQTARSLRQWALITAPPAHDKQLFESNQLKQVRGTMPVSASTADLVSLYVHTYIHSWASLNQNLTALNVNR